MSEKKNEIMMRLIYIEEVFGIREWQWKRMRGYFLVGLFFLFFGPLGLLFGGQWWGSSFLFVGVTLLLIFERKYKAWQNINMSLLEEYVGLYKQWRSLGGQEIHRAFRKNNAAQTPSAEEAVTTELSPSLNDFAESVTGPIDNTEEENKGGLVLIPGGKENSSNRH